VPSLQSHSPTNINPPFTHHSTPIVLLSNHCMMALNFCRQQIIERHGIKQSPTVNVIFESTSHYDLEIEIPVRRVPVSCSIILWFFRRVTYTSNCSVRILANVQRTKRIVGSSPATIATSVHRPSGRVIPIHIVRCPQVRAQSEEI
jgi:hypothetical protein